MKKKNQTKLENVDIQKKSGQIDVRNKNIDNKSMENKTKKERWSKPKSKQTNIYRVILRFANFARTDLAYIAAEIWLDLLSSEKVYNFYSFTLASPKNEEKIL